MMATLTFYSFTMGDVDDVEIYMAKPIADWQRTPQGQWVMKHAKDLRYYTSPDLSTFGHRITIRGEIDDKQATEFFLRWG